MPQVDLVYTKRTGEFTQNLCAKPRTVKLSDRVFQAVIKKAGRQLEQEVPLQGLRHSGCIEFVDQNAIDDRLPYFVVVFGFRLNIFWRRVERSTAATLSSVFAIADFSPEFLLKCYRTNTPSSDSLASTECSAFWARCLSWAARFSYRSAGCFLASMPGSFFCVVRKPNKGNQVFSCLDQCKRGGDQREVSKLWHVGLESGEQEFRSSKFTSGLFDRQ